MNNENKKSFIKWLKDDWIPAAKERRDMWSAMAYSLDNARFNWENISGNMYAGIAAMMEYKRNTVERWMLAELYMKWEDLEKGK
jgi:hypothetical protein